MLNDKQWEYLRNLFAGDSVVLELNGVRLNRYDFDKIYAELQRLAWRPIEEAPINKHGSFLVASYKYWPPYVVVNAANDCPLKEEYPWRTHHTGNMIHESLVTHWMPLPPTPKEGE